MLDIPEPVVLVIFNPRKHAPARAFEQEKPEVAPTGVFIKFWSF
jgi:hypothetical protein